MKSTKKIALIGALTFAFTASAFAQNAGGGNSGGASNGPSAAPDSMNAASGAMAKPSKGTTLHQQNKAHKQKGAAAAAAASSLGTNDKGAPQ
ncbi:hypothetical protein AWB67_00939 [Caballeronia terrestris]|uniref:Late embryogenesis abundant protein n=1 Tax=Caballeronia terrestris TaxID=1226301 RepID=A0A158FZA1_9BURK|nr:hypothetical protein [Caballeronia terrestris]SAL24490.1 hypothetical protein AWB67_00939 [Caballeronia terrestris]